MPALRDLLSRAALAACLLTGAIAWPAGAQAPAAVAPAPAAAASVAPAAARPAPVLPQIKAPEAAANPYGLRALWQQGDWVARTTLLILAIMSLSSWYVLIAKLLAQSRMGGHGKAAHQSFWKADTVRQGANTLQAGSPYRFIAESALEATRKHDGLIGQVDLNTWMAQSIERAVATVHSRTQEGLAVLATVGSTAPFVGLFGTVWGIYNALVKIGASGQASIDKVAGPVGEALIMTAIGLAVAVPAVLGYNWLVRRNKVAMDTVRAFGSDLHTVLLAARVVNPTPKQA
ncbi:MAG: MotA/TolQ/ExbB proton channel family protein [Ramlibacter sp.]